MKASDWILIAVGVGVVVWLMSPRQTAPTVQERVTTNASIIGSLDFGDNSGMSVGIANVGDHQNVSSEDRGNGLVVRGAYWQ